MQEFPNSGFPNVGNSGIGFPNVGNSGPVFQMSEIPESVCHKVGISGIAYVRFGKFLLLAQKERTSRADRGRLQAIVLVHNVLSYIFIFW